MFSGFRGKGSKRDDPAAQKTAVPRGMEVTEDDPDTAWGLWDSALVEQESRFGQIGEAVSAKSTVHVRQVPSVNHRDPEPPVQDFFVDTQPLGLEEKSPDQRREDALVVVEMHHKRIANTIRTMWGYKECSMYIYKLIMNGGDGMGHARIGFNQDAAEAMMALAELHDELFGGEEGVGNLGFGDPTVRSGLDGSKT